MRPEKEEEEEAVEVRGGVEWWDRVSSLTSDEYLLTRQGLRSGGVLL